MNIASRYKAAANRTSAKKLATPLGASDTLLLSAIRTDGGTQSRVDLDQAVVADYAAALADGAFFPLVTVFKDGSDYWLADGFHRHAAHVAAGKKKIAVLVLAGDRRDAILYSVGANQTHGLRRTNADKHRAVSMLLADLEWSIWSDGQIARKCAVSREFVNRLRPKDTCDPITGMERTFIHPKTGLPAQMDVTKSAAVNAVSAGNSAETAPASTPSAEPEDHAAFHEEVRANLPQAIRDMGAAKQQAIADRGSSSHDGLAQDDRIAELVEQIRMLEADYEALRAENKFYGEMKVQFAQGGFDKVVADKDEQIRVLQTRLQGENDDKIEWMKSAKFFKAKAIELGWSNDLVIPLGETGGDADV